MTTEELQTKLMRGYGLSDEDCKKVITLVAEETMTQYLCRPDVVPLADHVANPTFMQTTVGSGDQVVTRTWINVEAVAEQVAPQVTEMVANALADAILREGVGRDG